MPLCPIDGGHLFKRCHGCQSLRVAEKLFYTRACSVKLSRQKYSIATVIHWKKRWSKTISNLQFRWEWNASEPNSSQLKWLHAHRDRPFLGARDFLAISYSYISRLTGGNLLCIKSHTYKLGTLESQTSFHDHVRCLCKHCMLVSHLTCCCTDCFYVRRKVLRNVIF